MHRKACLATLFPNGPERRC